MEAELMIDSDVIAATLAAWKIPYLRGSAEAEPLDLTAPELISLLAESNNPRVNEALIPFFLRYPHHHSYLPNLVTNLSATATMTLKRYYTASVYLQQLWWITLGIYLGEFPSLPDYYGQSFFGLSAPSVHFGELGLRELAERLERETGFSWQGVFESATEIFLSQLRLQADDEYSYLQIA